MTPIIARAENSRSPGPLPKNPRAKTLKTTLLDQFVAILEGVQIGVEDPFAQLVPVEINVGAVVIVVPSEFAFVRLISVVLYDL